MGSRPLRIKVRWGCPPRVLSPLPHRTQSWRPCLPGQPWASGWRSTDRPVPSPRGWTIGFSERGAAHNHALPRCLSSRRCMRSWRVRGWPLSWPETARPVLGGRPRRSSTSCPGVMHHPPLPPGPGLSLPVAVAESTHRPVRRASRRRAAPPASQPGHKSSRKSTKRPWRGQPEMLEFALSQETARTAPLLPPVEGREENLLFRFVSVPPLVQGPAVPTFSKKEQFPFPPGSQVHGMTALPPHSHPRPIFPVAKRVRFGDDIPPHAPLASPVRDPGSSVRMLQNAPPSVPSTPTPFRCTTTGTLIVPLEPLAQRLEAWLTLPSLSRWLTRTIRLGYAIQFAMRPPKFNAVLETSVAVRNAPVFRLSLSPRVFTKVVEGALTPLREVGVRILNYLDDWLRTTSALATLPGPEVGMAPRYTASRYLPAVSPLPQPLDRPCLSTGRGAPRTSVPAYCCHNRCLQHGLGRYMQRAGSLGALDRARLLWHINCLELWAVHLALRQFRPLLLGKHVLVRTDNTAAVSYINRLGGIRSHRMSQLSRHLLLWSHKQFKSLRAVHIPGQLNRAADAFSRQLTFPGEWRLHPETIRLIWSRFGEAQADLFASPESSHCQLYFFLTEGPLGTDALAHSWPRALRKYAFPPVSLLAQTLCKLREDEEQVLLVAPHWPTRTWFPKLISLATAPPWRIPLREDLLSQGLGTIWHPHPDLWNLHVWLLDGTRQTWVVYRRW